MSDEEQGEQGQTRVETGSVTVRLLAALLVKDQPKPAAATRLLGLGLSVNDVARVLEIKASSVRVIKHRAKTKTSEPGDGTSEPPAGGA